MSLELLMINRVFTGHQLTTGLPSDESDRLTTHVYYNNLNENRELTQSAMNVSLSYFIS
jgi:hypothetical protein